MYGRPLKGILYWKALWNSYQFEVYVEGSECIELDDVMWFIFDFKWSYKSIKKSLLRVQQVTRNLMTRGKPLRINIVVSATASDSWKHVKSRGKNYLSKGMWSTKAKKSEVHQQVE